MIKAERARQKKIYAAVSVAVVLLIFLGITWIVGDFLSSFATTPESFVSYIRSFGWSGILVMFAFQVLQVFIALIPGEVVEIAAGYAYGPIIGTLICMVGIAITSTLIFLLVKKWGRALVEIFISAEKIDSLRFLNNEKRLVQLLFLLYFIPGTPKDVLNYFVGLTKMPLGQFLGISLGARIPSVVTSTVGGNFVSSGEYLEAVIIFAVTAVCSLIGMLIYNHFLKRRNEKKELC